VIRSGVLRNAGMLQDRSKVRDPDTGDQSTVWIDVRKVRFSLEATGGREIEVAGQVRAQSTFQIVMRWIPGVKTTMRILCEGRIFNITNINDVENRHRELDITAIEGSTL
jgi:SPP1 family predicted phage head-tail adaptor